MLHKNRGGKRTKNSFKWENQSSTPISNSIKLKTKHVVVEPEKLNEKMTIQSQTKHIQVKRFLISRIKCKQEKESLQMNTRLNCYTRKKKKKKSCT